MTTPTESPEPVTLYRVVDGSQLEQLTLDGWKIEQRFRENAPMPITSPHYLPPYDSNGYTNPGRWEAIPGCELGLVMRFLVSRRADNPIPELRKTIQQLQESDAARIREVADKEKLCEQLRQMHTKVRDQVIDLEKALTQQRNAKHKLETDIGKLREAVGEIRMREILGQPPVPAPTA